MVSSQLPATNYQFHHLTAAVAVCRSEEIDAGDQLDCADLVVFIESYGNLIAHYHLLYSRIPISTNTFTH